MADVALPNWLKSLAHLSESIQAEHLEPRFAPPPADARPSAVLVLFADADAGRELLLTERAGTLRRYPGQISFPGGATDPEDEDSVATALRETREEVGLDPTTVDVFGILPSLWLPPSNFAVTPVLGYWREPTLLKPLDGNEVSAVIHQSIEQLMDPENRFSVVNSSGWRGPAFDIGRETPMWGFTAGVISRLFARLGWDRPWDDSVTRSLPTPPTSGGR